MSYVAFHQWLPCDCGAERHGLVRLYREPKPPRQFILEDGLPRGGWAWICNFERVGELITVRGAKRRPPVGGRRSLLRKAWELGGRRMRWERSKKGRLLQLREFRIPAPVENLTLKP